MWFEITPVLGAEEQASLVIHVFQKVVTKHTVKL